MKRLVIVFIAILISLSITACSPGKLGGPTLTFNPDDYAYAHIHSNIHFHSYTHSHSHSYSHIGSDTVRWGR